MYAKYFKRILDILCALLAVSCFCWLYIILAILVKVKLGSPVLFTQPRPGKKDENGVEQIFKLYKFSHYDRMRKMNRGNCYRTRLDSRSLADGLEVLVSMNFLKLLIF